MITVGWRLGFVILTADPVSRGCVSVKLPRSVKPLPTLSRFLIVLTSPVHHPGFLKGRIFNCRYGRYESTCVTVPNFATIG